MIAASTQQPHSESPSLRASARFREISASFLRAAQSEYTDVIGQAGHMIIAALQAGSKLLVFGNGGSAADAQHFCGELVVRYQTDRQALAAVSLCSDAAVISACSNDFHYHNVFSRQIEALGNPGDLAFGISTSGNSLNVVKAFRTARERQLKTLLLTGSCRGEACDFADLVLPAPASNTARIQELHLASYHILCEMVDQAFSHNCGD